MWYPILVLALAAYFLGNINGAIFMSALNGQADIRTRGSGNAGFTNFLRNYGINGAALVGLIDFGKSLLGCMLGGLLLKPYGLGLEGTALGGFCVILGHNFPMLLGFRGGKGILCSAGLALMVDWRVFLVILAVFLILYFTTKLVSLASCVAVVVFAALMCAFYWGNVWIVTIGAAVGLLGLWMHRSNLRRLAKGTEQKTYLHRSKN